MALGAALATSVGAAIVGYVSVRGIDPGAADTAPEAMSFWAIIGKNLGAALLLYSGVCTVGVSTGIAAVLLGGFVGATWSAAVTAVGAATAGGSILWYAPLEMAGLVLAATAGMLPAVALMMRPSSARAVQSYTDALPASLRLLALAAAVLVVAALIEALVIGARG